MKKLGLLVLALFVFNSLLAQDGVGLRTGLSVKTKISDKFSVNADGQLRYSDDITFLQTYLAELGAAYKISKRFDVSLNYRFVTRRKNEFRDFTKRHRGFIDLKYDTKFGAIKFENRLRYQHQFKDNDGRTEFDASYFRNKIEFSFPNQSQFTPYVSADLFLRVGGKFDQIRSKVGVSYKLDRNNAFEVSVFKDSDLVGVESPGPVLGLIYKLKF